MMARTSTRAALCVFALSALIRIGWVSFAHVTPVSDFLGYHNLAVRLLDTSEFGAPGGRAYRTPGYPAFLAAIYTLFGRNWNAVAVIQALLGAATSALLVLLAARIVSLRSAAIAGILHAVWPTALAYTPALATENVANPLLLLALLSLVRSTEGPPRRIPVFAIVAGAIFGALLLVKPAALLALPALVLLAAFYSVGVKLRLKNTIVFVAVTAVVIAPWLVRNGRAGLGYTTLSTTGPLNLWMGNNDAATTGGYHTLPARFHRLSEGQRASVLMSQALSWISHNPARYLALCRTRSLRLVGMTTDSFAAYFLTPTEHDDLVLSSRSAALRGRHALSPPLKAASARILTRNAACLLRVRIVWAPLMLLGIVLAMFQWKRFALILLPALSLIAGVSMMMVVERFRQLFEPLLMIPVAALLNCVLTSEREFGPRISRATVTGLCAAVLLANLFFHETWTSWYSLEPSTVPSAFGSSGVFQPLRFDGPPESHGSAFWNRRAKQVTITGSATTLRADVTIGPDVSHAYGGVAFCVPPFKALRLDLEFIDLAGMTALYVDGYDAAGKRAMQWRWLLSKSPLPRRRRETYRFVPGQPVGRFTFEGFPGAGEVAEIHVFVQVVGDSAASFAVHNAAVIPAR